MKMIKAMKKLKFWSRKKKVKTKKQPFFTEQQSSESSRHYYHHHHCHYYPVEPSAPPLPSWLDYNPTQETTIKGTDHFASTTTTTTTSATATAGSSRAPFTTEEESVPGLVSSSQEEEINGKNTSYQQYMVENPVYGVPALPTQVISKRDTGAFGCVFSFGTHLLRCFFPCFHIKEATK